MKLTDAEQVAADIAALHIEKHYGEWLPVIPAGAFSLIAGHEVMAHVQSFADKVMVATGVRSIGTYPGHDPSVDRALDLFTPVDSRALGDAICAFFINNLPRFGGRYAIYRQHIWHRLDRRWVLMAPRGYPTQDHFDHVHLSFETEATEVEPEPVPTPKEHPDMYVTGRIVGSKSGLPCIISGGTFAEVSPATFEELVRGGVPVLPDLSAGAGADLLDLGGKLREVLAAAQQGGGGGGGVDIDKVAAKLAKYLGDRLAS